VGREPVRALKSVRKRAAYFTTQRPAEAGSWTWAGCPIPGCASNCGVRAPRLQRPRPARSRSCRSVCGRKISPRGIRGGWWGT